MPVDLDEKKDNLMSDSRVSRKKEGCKSVFGPMLKQLHVFGPLEGIFQVGGTGRLTEGSPTYVVPPCELPIV